MEVFRMWLRLLLKYYIFGSLCLPVARCFQFNNVSLLACSTAIIRTVLTIKNVKFDSHFLASLRNLKLLPGFTRRCLSPVFSSSQMRGSCCFNEFTIFQLKCTWCVQKRVLFEFNFSHRRSKLQSDWLTLVQVGIMHVAWGSASHDERNSEKILHMAAGRGRTQIVDGSTCWQRVGADYVNRNNGLFEGKRA